METQSTKPAEPAPIAVLAAGILQDTQKLVEQQVALAKLQLFEDWGAMKPVALWLALALLTLVPAGLLLSLTLVFVLHESSGMPLWSCFGIILLLYSIVGVFSLYVAREKSKALSFISE